MVLPRPIECTRGIGNLLAFPRTVLLHNLRVKAGLQNARAKGKRLGQPPKNLDNEAIMALRHNGLGWRAIAKQLGVRSAYRVAPGRSKIWEEGFGTRFAASELLRG